MVLHVVLFRPKIDVSDADRRAMFGALHTAASEIASVRRFYVGKRLTHGAAYEPLMTQNFPYTAIVEFDDLAGLQAYLQHPKHGALGDLFYRLQDAALVYDYEEIEGGYLPAVSFP
jgi:stress responsive alpha/beta barrel protein